MIASEADLPLIVDLGRKAHAASAWRDVADFDPASFEGSCRALIEDPSALVLVSPRASLWIKQFPLYFNHAETVAHEVFFAGVNAGALRREAERWAEGALITMSRNAATNPRLDTLYQRAGYVPVEHTFIRRA